MKDTTVSIKRIQYSYCLTAERLVTGIPKVTFIMFILNMEGMRRHHMWPLFMRPMNNVAQEAGPTLSLCSTTSWGHDKSL